MTITVPALLVTLFIGALAGWLAGIIMRGRGFGILGNIIVGILGAVLAAFLLPKGTSEQVLARRVAPVRARSKADAAGHGGSMGKASNAAAGAQRGNPSGRVCGARSSTPPSVR